MVDVVKMKQAMDLLDQIVNDRTVPKNIRKVAEDSKTILNEDLQKNEPQVQVSTVISMLDEVINDPNMPMYTRTQIWNIVSILEEERRKFS